MQNSRCIGCSDVSLGYFRTEAFIYQIPGMLLTADPSCLSPFPASQKFTAPFPEAAR